MNWGAFFGMLGGVSGIAFYIFGLFAIGSLAENAGYSGSPLGEAALGDPDPGSHPAVRARGWAGLMTRVDRFLVLFGYAYAIFLAGVAVGVALL